MGAWGSGPFENDDASDWVWDLEDETDATVIIAALSAAVDTPTDEQVDAPTASNAIAAAEVLASAHGPRSPDLPTEAVEWLRVNHAIVDERLRALAFGAVQRISVDSELKELWDDARDDTWAESVRVLAERLRR